MRSTNASAADWWYGPHSPNCTDGTGPHEARHGCAAGCLFDVVSDPAEHVNLKDAHPDEYARLKARYEELAAEAGIPPSAPTGSDRAVEVPLAEGASPREVAAEADRGPPEGGLCAAMWTKWGGHFGPWR
jgi:hypothetical protein